MSATQYATTVANEVVDYVLCEKDKATAITRVAEVIDEARGEPPTASAITTKADELRAMTQRSGGRCLVLKQAMIDSMETAARMGRLSHQLQLIGLDRDYAGTIADWLHEQGFAANVSEDSAITYVTATWSL